MIIIHALSKIQVRSYVDIAVDHANTAGLVRSSGGKASSYLMLCNETWVPLPQVCDRVLLVIDEHFKLKIHLTTSEEAGTFSRGSLPIPPWVA
jgi:hypothetical protein